MGRAEQEMAAARRQGRRTESARFRSEREQAEQAARRRATGRELEDPANVVVPGTTIGTGMGPGWSPIEDISDFLQENIYDPITEGAEDVTEQISEAAGDPIEQIDEALGDFEIDTDGDGGKKGGSDSDAMGRLVDLAETFAGETAGTREALFGMGEELITTGGIGANIPLINRALERTRLASSTAQQGTEANLARTGLTGTPFGQNILAEGARAGEMAAANVPTDFYANTLNLITNAMLGQGTQAMGGMGAAAGAEATQIASKNQMWGGLMGGGAAGLGTGLGVGLAK